MKILQGHVVSVQASDVDVDYFKRVYQYERVPVIYCEGTLTGHWPAMKKWNVDYFVQRYGDKKIPVALLPTGLSHPPNREAPMLFSTFVEHLNRQQALSEQDYRRHKEPQAAASSSTSSTSLSNSNELTIVSTMESSAKKQGDMIYYVQQAPLQHFDGLVDDLDRSTIAKMFEGQLLGANTLFIGSYPTRTTAHYDRPLVDNMFCQIVGLKRFRMWKPTEGRHFSLFGFTSPYAHVSKIREIDDVDEQQFPDYKNAKLAVDVILEPGDSIYIPKGWFHHVEHVCNSISISVNFWFY